MPKNAKKPAKSAGRKTARRKPVPRESRKRGDRISQGVQTQTAQIPISPAKGQPMLVWVGKRPLRHVLEKKTDLVKGAYVLSAPEKTATVAGEIIDMLGEEVLEIRKVY